MAFRMVLGVPWFDSDGLPPPKFVDNNGNLRTNTTKIDVFLEKNSREMSPQKIADKFKCSPELIRRRMFFLGLSGIKIIGKIEQDEMREKFLSGMKIENLMTYFNRNKIQVLRVLEPLIREGRGNGCQQKTQRR